MSKIGVEYAVFAPATINDTTGAVTHANGKWISPVVGFNGSANKTSGKDYGDNVVVATDNSVAGGTLTVELNHDEEDVHIMLVGNTKDTGTGGTDEIIHDVNDAAPYVGCGAVGKSRKGSATSYIGKWYPLVQFSEPNDDNATKGENVTFGHITVEGEILIPKDGKWKYEKSFTTLADAKTWLNGKAGIS